jgi:hypothetical protein
MNGSLHPPLLQNPACPFPHADIEHGGIEPKDFGHAYLIVDAGTGVSLTFGTHQRLGKFRSMILGLTGEPPYFVPLADGIVPEDPP